jgi:hypothetical protein
VFTCRAGPRGKFIGCAARTRGLTLARVCSACQSRASRGVQRFDHACSAALTTPRSQYFSATLNSRRCASMNLHARSANSLEHGALPHLQTQMLYLSRKKVGTPHRFEQLKKFFIESQRGSTTEQVAPLKQARANVSSASF